MLSLRSKRIRSFPKQRTKNVFVQPPSGAGRAVFAFDAFAGNACCDAALA